jgi:lambda repressor-like predicted transcriptional regulator
MTLASLARQYNLPAASIRVTLARKRPVIQADLAISDFLAVPLHQLWADRYDDKGNRLLPLKPRTRRKPPSPPLTEAA